MQRQSNSSRFPSKPLTPRGQGHAGIGGPRGPSAAYSQVGEPARFHLGGAVHIPSIDQDSPAHSLPGTVPVDLLELVPLRGQDYGVRALQRLIGILAETDSAQLRGRPFHGDGIVSTYDGSFVLQQPYDLDRRRVANVVGVGLEG